MKQKIYLAVATMMISIYTFSQSLSIPPNGGNKKASVSERIGITDVTIHYDRPGVKGREGKIWNNLVHTGFTDLGFGTSKAAPWRAGANENTTITFTTDVMVEGKPLLDATSGEVRVYLELGKTKLSRRFKVADMMYDGKLEY